MKKVIKSPLKNTENVKTVSGLQREFSRFPIYFRTKVTFLANMVCKWNTSIVKKHAAFKTKL